MSDLKVENRSQREYERPVCTFLFFLYIPFPNTKPSLNSLCGWLGYYVMICIPKIIQPRASPMFNPWKIKTLEWIGLSYKIYNVLEMLNSLAKLILVFSAPDLSPPQQAQPKIVSDPGLPTLEIPPWPTHPDLWPVEAWMAADMQILPTILMKCFSLSTSFNVNRCPKLECLSSLGQQQEGKV